MNESDVKAPENSECIVNRNQMALVGITKDLFETMFCEQPKGWWYRIEGLPSDAQFVRLDYDLQTTLYWLTFRHDSFREVKVGDPLPFINLKVKGFDQNKECAPVEESQR